MCKVTNKCKFLKIVKVVCANKQISAHFWYVQITSIYTLYNAINICMHRYLKANIYLTISNLNFSPYFLKANIFTGFKSWEGILS